MNAMEAMARGVRIAVIDSGVNPDHPHVSKIVGGRAFNSPQEFAADPCPYLDRLGHGTAVMAAIQEKAPAAECSAVRVFHTSLRTTGAALIEAIDWCISEGFDIVNLSLGSANRAHEERFSMVADRAVAAGTLLVSAREANGAICYPGALPTVFSVGLDWDCPRERFRCEQIDGQTIYYASGYPRPVLGVPPQRNLYGISFAVANMTGFVACACAVAGRGAPSTRRARVERVLIEMKRTS